MLTSNEKHQYWNNHTKQELITSLNGKPLTIPYQLIEECDKWKFFSYTNTGHVLHHIASGEIFIFILKKDSLFNATVVHEYFEGVAFREGFSSNEFKKLTYKYIDYFKDAYGRRYDEFLDKSIFQIEKVMRGDYGCHYFAILKEVDYVHEHYSLQERRVHQQDIYEHDRLVIRI